jgi:formylglycine-generating enzyme required for sulfatase activity
LYGSLPKRDKLRLIAILRESYTNPSSEHRKQIVSAIRDTLILIHKAENDAKDCEVIYSYIEFLEEFKEQEPVFYDLLTKFLDLRNAKKRRDKLRTEYGLTFIRIPSGEFNMGTDPICFDKLSEEEKKKLIYIDSEEIPSHKVQIKNDFYMSQTLVSNEMYYKSGFPYADSERLDNNPYSNQDKQPVNMINWYEAIIFAKWLGCTLPTEAEWEYACIGAKEDYTRYTTPNSDELISILDKDACYSKNSRNQTRPVLPVYPEKTNSLSLLDMLGNLSEWCLDWYSENFYKLCVFESQRFPNFDHDIEGKSTASYNSDGNLVMDDEAYNGDIFTFDVNKVCVDPVKKEPGKFESKCLRGGCFDWNYTNLRPTYRNHNPASNVYKANRFRLVNKEGID